MYSLVDDNGDDEKCDKLATTTDGDARHCRIHRKEDCVELHDADLIRQYIAEKSKL